MFFRGWLENWRETVKGRMSGRFDKALTLGIIG
jgi:hypothetical protein